MHSYSPALQLIPDHLCATETVVLILVIVSGCFVFLRVSRQVLEDYGYPNHALLTVHGFSLVGGDDNDGNIHDCVRIDALRPPRGPAEYWEMLARMQEVCGFDT